MLVDPHPADWHGPDVDAVVAHLEALRREMEDDVARAGALLQEIRPDYRSSGRNLLHYLALRRSDLRGTQRALAAMGLSSLGRLESHACRGLSAVLAALRALRNEAGPADCGEDAPTFAEGEALLAARTSDLLGPARRTRAVRIMVTMPSEAASDYLLVHDLLRDGMDCMRINCAHDDEAAWTRMVEHLRRAQRATGQPCRILMDLGGPKLRTGAIEAGPAVVKVRPERDAFGRVTKRARVALVPEGAPAPVGLDVEAVIPIDRAFHAPRGDTVTFEDARRRARTLHVCGMADQVILAEIDRTAYIVPETVFTVDSSRETARARGLAPRENYMLLRRGDRLILTDPSDVGRPPVRDAAGRCIVPAAIGVSLPGIFGDIQPGDAVWLDDGRIGGVLREVRAGRAVVEITHAGPGGTRLRAGKGINLPDTRLRLPALTGEDLEHLPFVAAHADMAGYSFVRTPDDVARLQEALANLPAGDLGIVLKIETRHAFEALPRLLLEAMRSSRIGVMIARGDLAVECGYERLAEIQEEVLWICEAAHVPVIWATQVLDSMARTGIPSRAEVTDAAMSQRAECVMLNKGPFVRDAVVALGSILERMDAHQAKKRAMLRPLQLAHRLSAESDAPEPLPG